MEVLTSAAAKGPSRDWLKIVKTTQAKTKIRQWFKKELKQENIDLGRSMVEKEAQRQATTLSAITKPEYVEPLLKKYAFLDMDDIYSSVGFGALSALSVVARLMEEQKRREKPVPPPMPAPSAAEESAEKEKRQQIASSHGVYLEGEPGMLVRFAHCCNPVPGDEIIGYITRGRGVTVHKADCINAIGFEAERMVRVSWNEEHNTRFNAGIQIVAYDHDGLLADLALLIGEMSVPIESVSAKVHNKSGTSTITLTVKITSLSQLERLMKQMQKRSDVIEVFRVST